MQNPESYERSLTQAEDSCAARIFQLLDLKYGDDGTIALSRGLPDCAAFDIGQLATGATDLFPSAAHHFRGSLTLYNRDRGKLQGWVMRLLRAFPINRSYSPEDELRQDSNVCQLRIAPETGAVSAIKTTTVSAQNSGEVATWTCTVAFDVVFICREDVDVSDDDKPDGSQADTQSSNPVDGGTTDEGGNAGFDGGTTGGEGGEGGEGGGSTGGDGGDLPLPLDD